MNEKRKRVLAIGVLVLCLLSLLWTEDYSDRRVIGLTELIASAGAWACAVWLWRAEWYLKLKAASTVLAGYFKKYLFSAALVSLLVAALVIYSHSPESKALVCVVCALVVMVAGGVTWYDAKNPRPDRDPDPSYPWNQPKRKNLILPGASPKMKELLEERNRRINRDQ